jgi:hypothetical protein
LNEASKGKVIEMANETIRRRLGYVTDLHYGTESGEAVRPTEGHDDERVEDFTRMLVRVPRSEIDEQREKA